MKSKCTGRVEPNPTRGWILLQRGASLKNVTAVPNEDGEKQNEVQERQLGDTMQKADVLLGGHKAMNEKLGKASRKEVGTRGSGAEVRSKRTDETAPTKGWSMFQQKASSKAVTMTSGAARDEQIKPRKSQKMTPEQLALKESEGVDGLPVFLSLGKFAGTLASGSKPAATDYLDLGVNVVGLVAPQLGAVIAVMTAFFAPFLSPPQGNDMFRQLQELQKKILKETESMIKSAILKDKLGEAKVILADLVKRAQSAYENVQLAPDHSTRYTELKVAGGIIEFAKKDVFHHACLSEPPGTACKDWQEAGTFAPAMLYCDLLINIKLAQAQEKLESNKKFSQSILEGAQKSAKEMVKLLSASMDTWTKKRKSMIKKPVVTEMGRKKCYMMPVEEITLDGGKTYPCTPQWRENTCDFAWMWNYHELACQSREKRKMEQKIKSKFTDKIQHLTDFVKMDIPRMFKDARWGTKKIRQPKKKHIRRRKRPRKGYHYIPFPPYPGR